MVADAQRLARMLGELGRVTDEPGRLTRTFLSPAMQRANTLVATWMNTAGLATRVDAVGNLIGTLPAPVPTRRTLLLGSHLDTVRDAGKFDGALGVLLPIVALATLRRRGISLPYNVEVVGFSEEEGVRFARAYLGSEGYTGRLPAAALTLRDASGVTIKDALRAFNGGTFAAPVFAHQRGDVLGYVEVHLEQGPVLENEGLAVGVVSGIAGQSRFTLRWVGRAGHAGTTPMKLRRDALAAAAEFTLAAESLARKTAGLVATVGMMAVEPGAANVIPGEVRHTLDVRHARDAVRRAAVATLQRTASRIAQTRGLKLTWQKSQDHAAAVCDAALTRALGRSVRAVQGRELSLVSGAGHDAVVLSACVPATMLFVRCREGLSHHPREYVATSDLAVALRVVDDFLMNQAHVSAS